MIASFLRTHARAAVTGIVVATILFSVFLMNAVHVFAEAPAAPATVDFIIEKKFSGPVPSGYTANQFTFLVTGFANPITVSAGTDDYASTILPLGVGQYTIEEVGPNGFVPGDWTIQWSGAGCQNEGNAISTTIDIEASDLGKANFGCRADNQYKPNLNTGTTSPTTATGTIVVSKTIVGTSTSPDTFSFTVNGGAATSFDVSGTNTFEATVGDYVIAEVSDANYTTSYSADCDAALDEGETLACEITNTWISTSTPPAEVLGCTDATALNYNAAATPGNAESANCTYSGGGGGSDDFYRLEGYVWHDDNENTEWDGFNNEDSSTTTEDELTGWTVTITNGVDSFATTTDGAGYYYFDVPAGTWTISETVEAGWSLITPASGSFVVTVPEAQTAMNWGQRILAYIIPVAQAANLGTFGPFNFGNNETVTTPGGGGSGPTGGGSGSGPKIELTSGGGGGTTNDDEGGSGGDLPEPIVLGEQVSIVPFGAPNTGAGGMSPKADVMTLVLMVLMALVAAGTHRYAR